MQIYKKIKFVDIAKKAGVSNAAVSRYVNGSGYVSEEKKKMIQKAMDELEYTISEKKEMKQNKIFAIVLPPGGKTMIGPSYLSCFSDLAKSCGYKVIPEIYNLLDNSLVDVLETISKCHINGIFIPFMPMRVLDRKTVDYIKNSEIPIVIISEFSNMIYPEITSIVPDLRSVGKIAVEKLYEKGCRKIAFISTNVKKNKSAYLQLQGFMDAVCELDILEHNYVIAEGDIYQENNFTIAGYRAAEKAFAAMPDIDGILGWTGSFTAGIMQYIYQLGLRIPDQIKIIGTDDDAADLLSPPLTTVNISVHRRCLEALELLLRAQDEEEWKHKKQVYIAPYLYYRGTFVDS